MSRFVTPKPTKLYMLAMAGQGDTDIRLVDKETWDWIMDPHRPAPPKVLAKYREENDEPNGHPHITSGSAVNDAALQAPEVRVDGARARFNSIKEAAEFIRDHNVEVVEEWSGYIY